MLSLRVKLETLRAEAELYRSDFDPSVRAAVSEIDRLIADIEFVCFEPKVRPAVIPEGVHKMLIAAQDLMREIRQRRSVAVGAR